MVSKLLKYIVDKNFKQLTLITVNHDLINGI